ncbi:hypothetical protein BFW86_16735 [Pseudomonas fluorescens]|nr:hypothetical protein BFW86_16735 [Pseudomonas fluorescens]
MNEAHPRNIAMAEGFKLVARSLDNESDRGSVVLAAAWLDESLTRIITKFLKPNTTQNEKLLKVGQPIGDFGTRIIIADRLRLITPNLISSLVICRRLRNDFAHLSSELSFATPYVQDRVDRLFKLNEDLIVVMGQSLYKAGITIRAELAEITAKDMLDAFGHKRLFSYTCGLINAGLALIEFDIRPCDPQFNTESLD